MERTNNYLIQVQQAKGLFLAYDQEALIRKFSLAFDESCLYVTMLHTPYRIRRSTGDLEKQRHGVWEDANTFDEVLTLFDLLCDSREDRYLSGRWKNMTSFGLMFHQNLLEGARDPWAEKFQASLPLFREACLSLGGQPMASGDAAYAIELFDGLSIGVQLWLGDEEFPPNLRFLWDENATMYIRYETMFYARSLLLDRIAEEMAAGAQGKQRS